MVYGSQSAGQPKGKLETKDEITQFLKTAELDFVEFYIMENGMQNHTPVATLEKNGEVTRVFYDRIQLEDFGAGSLYWVGCFPGWSIDQLIKLNTSVDKIMDEVSYSRKLQKLGYPN